MAVADRSIVCLAQLSQLRGIDKDKRQATYVAATEGAVDTWMGPEVLRMSGLKLDRWRKQGDGTRRGPFLDSHKQHDAGAVIGSSDVWLEGRTLLVRVTYATTPLAEERWTLVREGHLDSVSVGFIPRDVIRLAEGERDGRGEHQVTGPARIVREWELIEVSQVAIGADREAKLRRSFYQEGPMPASAFNYPGTGPQGSGQPPTDQASTRGVVQQSATDEPTQAPAPAAQQRAELPEEVEARRRSAINTQIRELGELCGLEDVAAGCILEGLGVEESRKRMLEQRAAANTPSGTPEPEGATVSGRRAGETTDQAPEINAESVLRAIKSLRS